MQRDSLGYVAGPSLFEYAASRPVALRDSSGLKPPRKWIGYSADGNAKADERAKSAKGAIADSNKDEKKKQAAAKKAGKTYEPKLVPHSDKSLEAHFLLFEGLHYAKFGIKVESLGKGKVRYRAYVCYHVIVISDLFGMDVDEHEDQHADLAEGVADAFNKKYGNAQNSGGAKADSATAKKLESKVTDAGDAASADYDTRTKNKGTISDGDLNKIACGAVK